MLHSLPPHSSLPSVCVQVLDGVTPQVQFVKVVNDELVELMGSAGSKELEAGQPQIILMAGLQVWGRGEQRGPRGGGTGGGGGGGGALCASFTPPQCGAPLMQSRPRCAYHDMHVAMACTLQGCDATCASSGMTDSVIRSLISLFVDTTMSPPPTTPPMTPCRVSARPQPVVSLPCS